MTQAFTSLRLTMADHTRVRAGFDPIALAGLFAVYGAWRLFFQQVVTAKVAFIYPTGLLLQPYVGAGAFTDGQWEFLLSGTWFVINEQCSGTTFFSLLFAYICYLRFSGATSQIIPWLLAAYPIAVIANVMRVQCAILIHEMTGGTVLSALQESLHVIVGVFAFLFCFLATAWAIDAVHTARSPG